MIQSDALSRRPDHCPNNDNDNEDIVLLPDHLFIHLIDADLQEKIALSEDFDGIATEALELLLNNETSSLAPGLADWELRNFNGRHILFYKGKNYIPRNLTLR
jgi:hypothetical protein